jgi:hypothetical protein
MLTIRTDLPAQVENSQRVLQDRGVLWGPILLLGENLAGIEEHFPIECFLPVETDVLSEANGWTVLRDWGLSVLGVRPEWPVGRQLGKVV